MISGTLFEQGDIVIVPFPFTDLSASKQRPVLVLSQNTYNKETEDIITCGITSNLKDTKHAVILEQANLQEGNIPNISRIKVDRLFTLKQSMVKKRIAKVDQAIMERVKIEFRQLV